VGGHDSAPLNARYVVVDRSWCAVDVGEMPKRKEVVSAMDRRWSYRRVANQPERPVVPMTEAPPSFGGRSRRGTVIVRRRVAVAAALAALVVSVSTVVQSPA
jgi:hypothetical protein